MGSRPQLMCDGGGNRGFILDVDAQIERKEDIQVSNPSIVYSFGTTNTPDQLDLSTGFIMTQTKNSLIYNSIQYEYVGLQFSKGTRPLHRFPEQGAPNVDSKVGELIMTFKKRGSIDVGEKYIVLRFPIFSKTRVSDNVSAATISPSIQRYVMHAYSNSKQKTLHVNGAGLGSLFTDGLTGSAGTYSIEYVTCIEVEGDAEKVTIRGILFPGHIIDFGADETAILSVLRNPVIPSIITGNKRTIRMYDGEGYGAGAGSEAQWGSSNEFEPRGFLNTLTASNITRMTAKPLSSGTPALSQASTKEMQKYKCMPIDVMRDIEGDRLVIDPTTGGEALSVIGESEKAELRNILPGSNPGALTKTTDTILTLVIIILSALLVFVIFMYIYKMKVWHEAAAGAAAVAGAVTQ